MPLITDGWSFMRRLSLPILLLITFLFNTAHPGAAQSENEPTDPDLTPEEILQACAQDQADMLPSPFTDVVPTDWAYKAVLTLYYCGAYRGAIPPELYQQYLEENSDSPG